MDCTMPCFPVIYYFPELAKSMFNELVRLSNHLILSRPLLLLSIFPRTRVFPNELAPLHWVAKAFMHQHQSLQWIFRVDILWDWLVWSSCRPMDSQEPSPASEFESINSLALSLLYCPTLISILTTGKTTALTRWTFVGKVMSLLFDMLSRFVIAFFPSSKCLLISWLESLSTVILEPKKIKFVTVSIFSSSVCHEVMGTDVMISISWILSLSQVFTLLFHPHQETLVPPCFLS